MYTLSSEQKLSNYEELIKAKHEKVENLTKEIKNLEAKADRLRKSLDKDPLLSAAKAGF